MTTTKLPKKLGKDPIIDVIFECRFDSRLPASNILPGIFYTKFSDEEKYLERLPQFERPEFVRNNDPSMEYLPLVRVRLEDYIFLIGDKSLAVACNLPYKGWAKFKEKIITAIEILELSELANSISRYSLKYANLIPNEHILPKTKLVNLDLRIGSNFLKNESFQIRLDLNKDDFINIIQIISNVRALDINGNEKEGLVIDIDTIKQFPDDQTQLGEIKKTLSDQLDKLHDVSKETFFDCLHSEILQHLEPHYE